MTVLEVQNLSISFSMTDGLFSEKEFSVITDMSLTLNKGEILTIVGSSGSGKSVFASALLDILPANAVVKGHILFEGSPVKNLLGKVMYLPQTSTFLDPLMKVDKQVPLSTKELSQKAKDLYPFQCSGGMIRSALFDLVHEEREAKIIIADEPTPGMDVDTATRALSDLRELANTGNSVILITHDIDLALHVSDRIAVFFAGRIVEFALPSDFLNGNVQHAYSKALYNALPQNGFSITSQEFLHDSEHK